MKVYTNALERTGWWCPGNLASFLAMALQQKAYILYSGHPWLHETWSTIGIEALNQAVDS